VDDQAFAARLESILLNRISTDRLVLPAFPTVAQRCLALVQSGEAAPKQIAATIEQDPMLVAQVLRIASAAVHGGAVQTVTQAVTRVGTSRLKTFLIEAAARRVFQSRDLRIQRASAAVWEHSLAVAILARDLAALVGSTDIEEAYLVGLLHDVGKPIVAAMMLDAERQLSAYGTAWFNSERWMSVVDRLHRPVGIALAESWQLSGSVQSAIRDCSDYNAANRIQTSNFVCFANAVAKTLGLAAGKVDLDDANALIMVGRSMLGLDDGMVQRLSSDLKARVRSMLE
jgi:putative nucleotidyltransferase with HDIG domain